MRFLIALLLTLVPLAAMAQYSSGETSRSSSASDSGPKTMYKQAADPEYVADRGKIYTKDNAVTGKVDLYYINDVGDVVQITSGGVTPVGSVEYEGLTTLTFDGAAATDYDGANVKCQDEATTFTGTADSHVCSVQDIISILNEDSTAFPATGGGWINGGPPGYTTASNDCEAWSNDASAAVAYGRWWDFSDGDNGTGWLGPCSESKSYVCCK